jgi:hypothetical protein
VRDRRGDIEAGGGRCIAVGFSPKDALAQLGRYLDWPWPFLADEHRAVYTRVGAGRAGLRHVYNAATLRRYAAAAARWARIRMPVEDTRQLGADALIRDGRAVWLYVERSPDDRPPAGLLVDLVRGAR